MFLISGWQTFPCGEGGRGGFQWHLQHICIWARHLASTFLLLYCSSPFRKSGKNKAHVYTVYLTSIQLYPRNCPDTVSGSEILKGFFAYLQSTCHERLPCAWILWCCSESPAANDKGAAKCPPLGMLISNRHEKEYRWFHALTMATVQALIAFLAWSVLRVHMLPACCNQSWPLHLFQYLQSLHAILVPPWKHVWAVLEVLFCRTQDCSSFRQDHCICRVGSWKQ